MATLIVAGVMVFFVAGWGMGSNVESRKLSGRVLRVVTTWNGAPVFVVVAVLSAVFVLIAEPVDSHGESTISWLLGIAIVGASAGSIALLAFLVGVRVSGFDPDSRSIARQIGTTAASQALVYRWLARRRYRRWLGGLLGLVCGALFLDGDFLTIGLIGVAAGSMSSEFHLCAPNRRTSQVAGLHQRRFGDYIVRPIAVWAGVIATALATSAVTWTVLDAWTDRRTTLFAILVTLVGITVVMVGRVARRRRPAVRPDLRSADDLLRRLSVTNGIVMPMVAVLLVLFAQAWAGDIGSRSEAGNPIATGFAVAGFIVWVRNRRGGLDYILSRPPKSEHQMSQHRIGLP